MLIIDIHSVSKKSDFQNAAEAQKFLSENQCCRAKFSHGYELGALDPAES